VVGVDTIIASRYILLLALIVTAITASQYIRPAANSPGSPSPTPYEVIHVKIPWSAPVIALNSRDKCMIAALNPISGSYSIMRADGTILARGTTPLLNINYYTPFIGLEGFLVRSGDTIAVVAANTSDTMKLPGLQGVVPIGEGKLLAYYSENTVSLIEYNKKLLIKKSVNINLSMISPIYRNIIIKINNLTGTENLAAISLKTAGLLIANLDTGQIIGPIIQGYTFPAMKLIDNNHLLTLAMSKEQTKIMIIYLNESGFPVRILHTKKIDSIYMWNAIIHYYSDEKIAVVGNYVFKVEPDYKLRMLFKLSGEPVIVGLRNYKLIYKDLNDNKLFILDLNDTSISTIETSSKYFYASLCKDNIIISYMKKPYIDLYTIEASHIRQLESPVFGPAGLLSWAGSYLVAHGIGRIYLFDTSGTLVRVFDEPAGRVPINVFTLDNRIVVIEEDQNHTVYIRVLEAPELDNTSLAPIGLGTLDPFTMTELSLGRFMMCGERVVAAYWGMRVNSSGFHVMVVNLSGSVMWHHRFSSYDEFSYSFGNCADNLMPISSRVFVRSGQGSRAIRINLSLLDISTGRIVASTRVSVDMTSHEPLLIYKSSLYIVNRKLTAALIPLKTNAGNQTLIVLWDTGNNTTRIAWSNIFARKTELSVLPLEDRLLIALREAPGLIIVNLTTGNVIDLALEGLSRIHTITGGRRGVWVYGVSDNGSLTVLLLGPALRTVLFSYDIGLAPSYSRSAASTRDGAVAAFSSRLGAIIIRPALPKPTTPGATASPSTTAPPGAMETSSWPSPQEQRRGSALILIVALALAGVVGVLAWRKHFSCCHATGA